ncbi:zinc-binding dehydrogenase [Streptomyces sp. NBC_00829]|uniref:zinc-binding dehydrogenase n=1 Tax=Streptomyces sp. NBC_00829 TaxID=2903679 RepID=UPI00386B6964
MPRGWRITSSKPAGLGWAAAAALPVATFSAGGTEPGEIALAEHVRLAAEGRLSIPVAEVFPLEEAAKAHALSETGHERGKLVIIPSQG